MCYGYVVSLAICVSIKKLPLDCTQIIRVPFALFTTRSFIDVQNISILYTTSFGSTSCCATSTSATYQLQISLLIFSQSLFRLIVFSCCIPAFTFFPYRQWMQWFQQPRLFDRCLDRTSCGVVGPRESVRDIDVDDSSCPVGRLCALLEAGL